MEKSLWYHYSGNYPLVLVPRQEVQFTKDPCAKEDPIYCYHLRPKKKQKDQKVSKFRTETDTEL